MTHLPQPVERYDSLDLAKLAPDDPTWAKGPVVLVRTHFHRGGVLSRHRTVRAAWRVKLDYERGWSCLSGCVGIIRASDYRRLPGEWERDLASHELTRDS